MKTTVITLMILIPGMLTGRPSGNPYTDHMMQARVVMDSATVTKTYLTAAGYFERIAVMSPGEWLPCYYAAYCYTRISHLTEDAEQQDQWIDRAQAQIDRAYEMDTYNAEILIMKGFILQARMNINPLVRGIQYNHETMGYFEKARALDPENPRSYLWQGVNLLHTPEAFGGGKTQACVFIRKSFEKFESFVPADSLAPDWGFEYSKEMIELCK